MRISVIIPTLFDRPQFIRELLNSLSRAEHTESDFEIIVVDNNPSTKQELQELINRWNNILPIRLLHAAQNGLHHARHAGAKEARGSLLIFVDDDVLPPPGWLSAYTRFFQSTSAVCAGGKVMPQWELPPSGWMSHLPQDIFSLLDYGQEIRVLNQKEGINGCNFAIRKETVLRYGGFHPDGYKDPSLWWLRGDGEYGLIQKIKAAGENVYYLPSAGLYHRIPASRMDVKSIHRLFQNHAVSRAYSFARKHHCSISALMALASYALLMSIPHLLGSRVSAPPKAQMDAFYVTRYLIYIQYVYRLLKDKQLRNYVQRDNYLEG